MLQKGIQFIQKPFTVNGLLEVFSKLYIFDGSGANNDIH